jgi:hypothetical protein
MPYTSSGYGSPGRWPHSLGTGRAGFRRSPNLNEYVLIVSDNGCGSSGTPDGKGGLGKTIINGLAAQLQAQITCENGKGTTVTVKIPMRERADHIPSRIGPNVPCTRWSLRSSAAGGLGVDRRGASTNTQSHPSWLIQASKSCFLA